MPYCARHMRRAYPMFGGALGDRRPAPPHRPGSRAMSMRAVMELRL